jgi:hypothetical protein
MSENRGNTSYTLGEILDRVLEKAEAKESPSFRVLVETAQLDPTQDFVGASLRDMDFRDEDLRGFDFSRADLTGADFRRANIEGVRFDDADLTGAIGLSAATLPQGKQISNPMETPPTGRRGEIRRITRMTLAGMLVQTGIRRRAQHFKQHGCVHATFEVLDDIPADYKVGLFARPASYDAIIRFSNGRQAEDRRPGAQGMSIKLIGVPGRKILEAQADAGTHDFILVDGPVFFVRDTESYARLVNEVFTNVMKGLPPEAPPEKWLASVKKAHPEDIPVVENYTNRVVDSPLARQFWSQVPYAFGQGDGTICRYSAVPHPENMIAPIPPAFRDADYLRRAMVDHLKTAARPAVFDFCAQLRTDATPEVIDSPTVEWDTPFQRVAVITIPAQNFDRPEQDRFGENLSYTPWHALPEHRPVGQINEIRRSVYAASSRARHLAKLVYEQEPTRVYPPKS